MNLEHVRAVATQELKDLFRNRQVWVSLLVQPIVFLLMMGFVGYIAEQRGNAFRTQEFKAVVSGDARDTAVFEPVLDKHRFRTVRASDIEDPVVGGDAEVGLRIPSGTAKAIGSGDPVDIEVLYMQNRDQSEVALGRMRVALSEMNATVTGQRLRDRGLPRNLVEPIRVNATSAGSTDRGARLALSGMLPGLLLFQSVTLVTTAAQRLSGTKEKRTLEPLLVMPIARRDILLGAGLATCVIGIIPAAAFIVPVTVVSVLPFALTEGLSSPLLVTSTLLMVAPFIAALMVAVGLMVGTSTRTSEGGGAISNLAFVPIFALGMLFMTVDSLPSGLAMHAIPVYGAALFTRDSIANGISMLPFFVTAASTVICAALLLALGSRSLETELSILRPSG